MLPLSKDYINYRKKVVWSGGDLNTNMIEEPPPINSAKVRGAPLSENRPLTGDVAGAFKTAPSMANDVQYTPPKPNSGSGSVGAGLAANAGSIAAFGTSAIDVIDKGNERGRQSTGAQVGKGALAGAAAGSIVGPWGTVIGGVVGAGVGLVGGITSKKKDDRTKGQLQQNYDRDQVAQSNARLSADQDLVTGHYEGATGGYYAGGGSLTGDHDHDLYDNVNRMIGQGGNPMQSNYGSITSPGINSANAADRRTMLTDLGIYNRRTDVQGMNAEQRINNYYQQSSNNPAVTAIKNRFKGYGYGPVSSYGNDSSIDKGTLAKVPPPQPQPMAVRAAGGPLFQAMSKHSTEMNGPSHEQGGIDLGDNEVEGDESIDKGYVFSSRLGFSDIHKPMAKAIGKMESKPYTASTANSLRRMQQRVESLKQAQEFTKQHLNIQS